MEESNNPEFDQTEKCLAKYLLDNKLKKSDKKTQEAFENIKSSSEYIDFYREFVTI